MTFFATSIEILNLVSLGKSTMAESRKQKFAHVYENGADSSHSMHSETRKFAHMHENGDDSSNLTHSET